MDVKFVENKPILSQRTLVKILKEHKYYFMPINDYSNELFYCIVKYNYINYIQKEIYDFLKWDRLKPKTKYVESKLSMIIKGENYNDTIEPIVFDRKEIENIIKDSSENYIGGKVL